MTAYLTNGVFVVFWLMLLAILSLVGLLIYFILSDLMRKKMWVPRILDSVFLEISLPKENTDSEKEPQKEEKDMIAIAEQFFATILETRHQHDLKHFLGINDYISLEIAAVGKKISFYINVPKKLQSLIEKQLHAQYPTAHIEQVKPYNIFVNKPQVAAAELALQKKYVFPVRTYKSMESDPINSLTNS